MGGSRAPPAKQSRSSPYSVPNSCHPSLPRYWSAGSDHTEDGEELDANRPSFSFTCLIGLAILSSEAKQLTVGHIYEYIQRNFPYFQTARSTWRNSVRHVLSLNKFFQKPDDGKAKSCKGGVWMVKPLMLTLLVEHIAEGQQRLPAATAKHLGLPELKRFIVKSRIGKASRRRRTSSSSSSSSLTTVSGWTYVHQPNRSGTVCCNTGTARMLFTWWRQAGRGPKHPSAPCSFCRTRRRRQTQWRHRP